MPRGKKTALGFLERVQDRRNSQKAHGEIEDTPCLRPIIHETVEFIKKKKNEDRSRGGREESEPGVKVIKD